jgi:hypothetical protein
MHSWGSFRLAERAAEPEVAGFASLPEKRLEWWRVDRQLHIFVMVLFQKFRISLFY